MNTDILLAAEGSLPRIEEGFEKAQDFIRASEKRFTRFSEDSELSELNRSAGTPFRASIDLFSVVSLAQRFFHMTRGLFDPSILPDLQRMGYNRSMDLLGQQEAAPMFEFLRAGEHPSFSEVEFDERRYMILLPAGMSIDLGGIAKGWIAEQAALVLSDYASTCAINAGGDMFLIGLPEGEENWSVALEDPLNPENTLTTLKVNPGAVATSSITKRTWKQSGKNRHHIIDPRTREPVITDWLSMTVIAAHAWEAEVFAKALIVGGPKECEAIIHASGIQLSYLAVDRDLKIWGTQKSPEFAYVR
jgi:thiamine biosynthesis lipoprotein